MKAMPGLQVLVVEDDLRDAALLRSMFSKEAPGSFHLTQVSRMSEAESYLASSRADLILLDLGLPDARGLHTLRRARAAAPGAAIIVLSGMEDESLATAAIREGAQDYVIKGQVESRALPRVLRHTIAFQRQIMETAAAREAQLQVRDDFLSHVSHELRGPLTAIYSFATILADGLAGETTVRQADHLHSIVQNVEQLQAMLEELLEVTHARVVKLGMAGGLGPTITMEEGEYPGTGAGEVRLPFGLPAALDSSGGIIRERWVLKVGGVF